MKRITIAALAGTAVLFAGAAHAQAPDFSKVEITTSDLGNKTYMLQGQGGNITVAVGTDGIIMVDSQFAPLHDKIKAAIAKISPLPVKYLINTHYHGDHVGGNAAFHKEGAIIVGHDNIRVRMVAGTTNGLTGNKVPPAEPDAVPTQTWLVGDSKVEVGGRVAQLYHTVASHTDGDTWVYFADANVLATGDIMNNFHRYQQVDYANGGDIRGMVRGTNEFLKLSNDSTKVDTGHGGLATKADIVAYNEMVKTAAERVGKLFREGKSEDEVVALDPLKDLNATWAANPQAAVTFLKQVYHSFERS